MDPILHDLENKEGWVYSRTSRELVTVAPSPPASLRAVSPKWAELFVQAPPMARLLMTLIDSNHVHDEAMKQQARELLTRAGVSHSSYETTI